MDYFGAQDTISYYTNMLLKVKLHLSKFKISNNSKQNIDEIDSKQQ
jgi:hypothetical protein